MLSFLFYSIANLTLIYIKLHANELNTYMLNSQINNFVTTILMFFFLMFFSLYIKFINLFYYYFKIYFDIITHTL
jgi:hypothetical protein